MRVTIVLDVPEADPEDTAKSVYARLADEAGYLNDGYPIVPRAIRVEAAGVAGISTVNRKFASRS